MAQNNHPKKLITITFMIESILFEFHTAYMDMLGPRQMMNEHSLTHIFLIWDTNQLVHDRKKLLFA